MSHGRTLLSDSESAPLAAILELANSKLDHCDDPQAVCDMLNRVRDIRATDEQRYALGVTLLRASNGREGWDLYDLHPSRDEDRMDGIPRWDGTHRPLLVLIAEQGYGDAIQFLRYVPAAAQHADTVIVAVHDELLHLVASSPMLTGTEVISKSALATRQWPEGTRWERLMSLPRFEWITSGNRVDRIAAYLSAPSRGLFPRNDSRLTVGISWKSTPRTGIPDRSLPVPLIDQFLMSLREPAVWQTPGVVAAGR